MANGNDGSGRAPVAIVRPTTTVTSGVGVTQKLVTAAVAFGDLMQGTFGPKGLDKMLYKTNGETAVTNDGAKIVAELLVNTPLRKPSSRWPMHRNKPAATGLRDAFFSQAN